MTTNQVTTVQGRDYIAARDIYAESTVNGGGTFNLRGESAKAGVAVTTTVLAKVEELTTYKVLDAIEHLRDLTQGVPEEMVHLGTWYDDENGVWEISQTAVMETREGALLLGSILGERYVYDIDAAECIAVA